MTREVRKRTEDRLLRAQGMFKRLSETEYPPEMIARKYELLSASSDIILDHLVALGEG